MNNPGWDRLLDLAKEQRELLERLSEISGEAEESGSLFDKVKEMLG